MFIVFFYGKITPVIDAFLTDALASTESLWPNLGHLSVNALFFEWFEIGFANLAFNKLSCQWVETLDKLCPGNDLYVILDRGLLLIANQFSFRLNVPHRLGIELSWCAIKGI